MRDELTLIELADRYLRGELNPTDRAAFEERMRSNAELRELVEDQRALLGGMERLAFRPAVNKAYRSYKLGKWAPGIGGAAVVAILAVGGWLLAKEGNFLADRTNGEASGTEQLLTLSDTTGIGLPASVMTIDPKADTTLLTPNGLVVDIPKGTFIDEAGKSITKPVRVTLLEAIDGVDIVKAGLSTMSGDTLLETGGMFYLDAQVDGKRASIDPSKPLTVMVPADKADPRMMLYEGVMTAEGIVDWRNPQPLTRTLVPVDISTLDFYPPGYLAKVAELGKDATDKRYTDSLYYSFTAPLEHRRSIALDWPHTEHYFDSDSIIYSAESLGHTLFISHCSSCHKTVQDFTGPALKGAKSRWAGKGNIYDYVRNSQAVIKSGNEYAIALFNEWNKSVMPAVDLTDVEIDAIFHWVDYTRSSTGIDPAKVQAIWNERFNGSNLATREFEERMREIHRTCDDQVLDLYVNNLERNLSQLDSMAVRMGHGAFASFALRNDERVELPAHAAERLRRVYREWSMLNAQAAANARRKVLEEQQALEAQDAAIKQADADAEFAVQQRLIELETEANLRSVYTQLGYAVPPAGRSLTSGTAGTAPLPPIAPTRNLSGPPNTAFVAQVRATGWKNVDRALVAARERESVTISDGRDGRQAQLTYDACMISIPGHATYEDVRVYLLPQSVNSYQRMRKGLGERYEDKINAQFTYDVVVLASKDGGFWYAEHAGVKGNTVKSISLDRINEAQVEQRLRDRLSQRGGNVRTTLARMGSSKRNGVRRERMLERAALVRELMPVVFPCAKEEVREPRRPAGIPAVDEAIVSPVSVWSVDQVEPPQFPGGDRALRLYLLQNQQLPDDFRRSGSMRKVFVRFVVLASGQVSDPRSINVAGDALDREAERLVREMPTWIPGKRDGRPVSVEMNVPVTFLAPMERLN